MDVDIALDRRTRMLRGPEGCVRLRPSEAKALEALIGRRGLVLTRHGIAAAVWGAGNGPDAEQMSIRVLMFRLRAKLAAVGAIDCLGSVWGEGYVLRTAITRTVTVPVDYLEKLQAIARRQDRHNAGSP